MSCYEIAKHLRNFAVDLDQDKPVDTAKLLAAIDAAADTLDRVHVEIGPALSSALSTAAEG